MTITKEQLEKVARGTFTAEEAMEAARELIKLRALFSSPELHNFVTGVQKEAVHQRMRWGEKHDEEKTPEDWFWTLGYLGGKALSSFKAMKSAKLATDFGETKKKALHHCITAAALLFHWHDAIEKEEI